MTTAEKIEGMTDAGQYEILTTRVLRELDADCRAVVHAGVNAQGKTIANPLDAFCLVPGSNPPRYVMAGFTLTAPDGLTRKWLFDHKKYKPSGNRNKPLTSAVDDGDLIKAGREAAAIRANYPDAKFVVWLCTNRRLDNSLQQPAYDKAAELGIEVRFLEQSQLRDFLDVRPEGQWLRQEHLGIQADQISGSLLRRLSQNSQNQYASDLLLPPQHEIVSTKAAETAADNLRELASLHLLVGPSGVGKSVIAHDLLRGHLGRDGVGLWIPAEVADREASLADVVEVVIRSLHPRAGVGSGHEALKLGTPDLPFVLVIDDVNRSPAPVRLLRKVIGWSRPGHLTDGIAGAGKSSILVICPAWDAVWYPLRHTYDSISWLRVQPIGPMKRPEAVDCLRATLREQTGTYSDGQLADFAERLHDDPILLGLFGRLLKANPAANPLAMAENVIGRMTEQAIAELAASNNTPHVDYSSSLIRLSVEMIRRKNLYPRWKDAEAWFQAEPAVRMRLAELAAQGHVCRLTGAAGVRRLEFRHDRVLEYHLSLSASGMLLQENDDRDAVADPYFTPFVGRAIARAELPRGVLEWIWLRNPVALIAAVPYLVTSPSGYADAVVQLARSWLMQAGDFPDSMRFAALWTLARANTPRVLDVTEGTPGKRRVWEARLRNGDAAAGAWALSREFSPAVRDPWLESLIEDARTHHGLPLTEQLRGLLRSKELDDQQRYGALCLAGYLADPHLAADVKFAWESASAGRNVLLAALWAACRCAGDAPDTVLGPMMPSILILQHDDSGQSVDERGSLLQELGFASRHGFGEPVLACLAELGNSREEFRWIVAAILDDIDHPIAIEYVVRLLAEAKHKAEQAGRFSPWAMIWGDRWKQMRKEREARLSRPSGAALKSLWAEKQNPEWLQDYAFSHWARYVADLSELAAIQPDCRHYEGAAWERALRNDRQVAAFVLAKSRTDAHWFHVVPRVWGAEFEPVIDAALSQLAADPDVKTKSWSNQHFSMSHLLRDIPTDAAERLLSKHWNGLSRSGLFIQAALYHGTPKCRELAASSLAQQPEGDDPFKHVGSFFGFHTQGLMDRLTPRHLEILLRYLQRLDDSCLGDMLDWCRRFDCWPWAKAHLEPEMRRRVSRAKPDFDGGPSFIVRVTQHWFPTDEELHAELDRMELIDPRFRHGHFSHWWDNFVERGDPPDRAGGLIVAWLANNPSQSRFVAAAELVEDRGKRGDLQALQDLRPVGEDTVVNRAAAAAEFAVKRRSLD
ncbi:MAG: hypothetical protein HY040_09605 [Planctomycetes bacterium]|nr:hypothetical protein [Planctomycetota bacterium]